MSWTFDPKTKTTGEQPGALLRRVQVEDAVHRLTSAGVTNRFELIRIVCALTGLSAAEVRATVDLCPRPDIDRRAES